MGSEQYCLKWNNHWANLVRVFNSLRHSETFVDVTIACEGRHIKAHRLILSACSPYFKELLVSHPDKHPIIILKDVRFSELQSLIQFIYNGEVSVEQHDLPSLLCTARELHIKGLADNCISTSVPPLHPRVTATKAPSAVPPITTYAPAAEQSARKDSTNISSILFPTIPKELPTNVNNSNSDTCSSSGSSNTILTTTTTTTTTTNSITTTGVTSGQFTSNNDGSYPDSPGPDPLGSPRVSPGAISSSRSPLPPFPPLPPLVGGPSSRGGSPVSKRRKMSRTNLGGTTPNEGGVTSLSDDVIPLPRTPTEEGPGKDPPAGPSGLPRSPLDQKPSEEEPVLVSDDSSDEKENQKPEVEMLKELKDKPPDAGLSTSSKPATSVENTDGDEEAMNIQHPEVILEEDISGVVTTNGTSSPPPVCPLPTTQASREGTPKDGPKATPPLSGAVPPQISFLQQALAMGYPQPIHFLPQNLGDQQTQNQLGKGSVTPSALPMGGNQALPPQGLLQAKNILSFVDLLKVMGAAIPTTTSQGGSLSNAASGVSAAAAAAAAAVAMGSSHHQQHGGSPSSMGLPAGYPTGHGSSSPTDPDRRSLTCHICARIMPSLQVLEEHVRIHEEEKPYKCEQCGQRYKYQSAFQRHQDQNHTAKLPGDKPYRCDVCGQCFKYHKSFTKHRANHDLLDSFMKAEPVEDGKGAIRALQESYLQRLLHPPFSAPHISTPPIKEEVRDCSEDEASAKGPKSPCLVSSTSLPGGPFGSENGEIKEEEEDDIDIDEIVPDVPGDGEVDLESASGGKFYFCLQCNLTFKDTKSFEGHCRLSPGCNTDAMKEVLVSGDISVSSVPSSVAPSPQGSPQPSQSTSQAGDTTSASAPSSSASLVFSSPPAMLYTLVSGLPQASNFPNASTAPTILNFSKLVNFGGIPTLANAMRASESMSMNFGNSVAGGLPGGVNSILGGMEEERPFKCPYCQKGFKGRENLKLHIRTHTGEKPYNCGVCGKAFGGRSDMNRHLRIHTGEKPYPCKVCGKKFARADYLSKHITTHLGIPFAKPVHSLQQSLQNLENMQNIQNLENLQTLQSLPTSLQSIQNLQAPVANLQNLTVPGMQSLQGLSSISNLQNLQQSFPSLANLPTVQNLQNLQSVQALVQPTQTTNKDEIPSFTK